MVVVAEVAFLIIPLLAMVVLVVADIQEALVVQAIHLLFLHLKEVTAVLPQALPILVGVAVAVLLPLAATEQLPLVVLVVQVQHLLFQAHL
jgi:hypothetical protein